MIMNCSEKRHSEDVESFMKSMEDGKLFMVEEVRVLFHIFLMREQAK